MNTLEPCPHLFLGSIKDSADFSCATCNSPDSISAPETKSLFKAIVNLPLQESRE
jgi:hypothetical protein